MSGFPSTEFDGAALRFDPGPPPTERKIRFVLVFVFVSGGVLLADIFGRGWCVPSGAVEPGETPMQAAMRETLEETGWRVGRLAPAGFFVANRSGQEVWSQAFISLDGEEKGPPTGNDSLDRRVVPLDGLAAVYFQWDSFYEAVFNYMAKLAKA